MTGSPRSSATTAPAPSSILRAAGLASRAPSLHNSQPWLWSLDGPLLHLRADRRRHLPSSDPDRRGIYLSCGMMLHHMRVALAAVGWATTVERFPDDGDADLLAVLRMTPTPPTIENRHLAASMLQRRSDRRRFSSYPVPEHVFAPLTVRAAREGVVLERLEVSSALAGAVHAAARIHAGDDAYRSEIEGWSGSFREVDGVPARNVPRSSASDGAIASRRFAAASLADTAAGGHEGDPGRHAGDPGSRAGDAEDAGAFLVMATPGDDHFSHLRAGEASSAVLLEATSFGLSTCPISEALEVPATRRVLQQSAMSSGCFPQLIIRMGWARPGAKALPLTPRRPVADILTTMSSGVAAAARATA
ncbi:MULTISPECIES: nitroreductase family protein [unclassified Dietzia]|uniref:Acg family FMN-binding oxidoreductase n=1 Tax=unclassified Dietzia TaxID=2617939 RepID=UPI000D228E28|nr:MULTISPECIES: nitroreductase family protein [unclassified Dietzia]AVZ39886.1 NAD(P)H nitroreductase [Dietzia sp. JS16-p6b]